MAASKARVFSFFFDVTSHQQVILENLAVHLGSNADVTYACAAFLKKKELFSSSSITAKSTFPPVAKLQGHERWYYHRAGAQGVAHSDPEAVQALPLPERIAQLERRHPPALPPWFPDDVEGATKEEHDAEIARRIAVMVPHLGRVWGALSSALEDVPAEQASPAQEILEQARSVDEKLPEHVRLVVKISTVTAHLDLAWLVVGPGK
jgi:hypothetical protein